MKLYTIYCGFIYTEDCIYMCSRVGVKLNTFTLYLMQNLEYLVLTCT